MILPVSKCGRSFISVFSRSRKKSLPRAFRPAGCRRFYRLRLRHATRQAVCPIRDASSSPSDGGRCTATSRAPSIERDRAFRHAVETEACVIIEALLGVERNLHALADIAPFVPEPVSQLRNT